MEEKKIGYHGLPREYVKKTLATQQMHESKKDNEWLGKGVYFFEYLAHAKWWVTHTRFEGRETAILQALLSYNENQLLDLDDPEESRKINRLFSEIVSKRDVIANPFFLIEQPTDHQKCCFICNVVRKLNPEIGIIIYTFPCDIDHNNSSVFQSNQRQICVSDHSIISDIKEVG